MAVDLPLRFVCLGANAFAAAFSSLGRYRRARAQGPTIQNKRNPDHGNSHSTDDPWKLIHRSTALRILTQRLRRLYLACRIWGGEGFRIPLIRYSYLIGIPHIKIAFVNGRHKEPTIWRRRERIDGGDGCLATIDRDAERQDKLAYLIVAEPFVVKRPLVIVARNRLEVLDARRHVGIHA